MVVGEVKNQRIRQQPGKQHARQCRRQGKPGLDGLFGHQGGGGTNYIDREPDRRMGVRIPQAVMVEDLKQFRLLQRGNGLARLVVVHKDDLETRRVERLALTGNAEITPILIHDPEFIVIIAQDPVERVADVGIGRIHGDGSISGVPAGSGHQLADGGITGARSQGVHEILKKAEAIDQTKGPAILADNRCNTAGLTGKGPCLGKLGIRGKGVQTAHDGFEARGGVRKQNGRIQTKGLQDPGGLRIEGASVGGNGIQTVPFAQEPCIAHGGCHGIGIRVDMPDDVNVIMHGWI